MSVLIIGNVVNFMACRLNNQLIIGNSMTIKEFSSSVGNDSAIVAIALAMAGKEVSLMSINKVDKKAKDILLKNKVNMELSEEIEAEVTTIMIEEKEGRRTFITSEFVQIQSDFYEKEYELIYIDLYDENINFIKNIWENHKCYFDKCTVWINLSSSNIVSKCEILSSMGIKKAFIQLGCEHSQKTEIIKKINKILPQVVIIATCGPKGSVICENGEIISEAIPEETYEDNSYIGSGAFFAAYFIEALIDKKDLKHVQKYATKKVELLCSKRKMFLLDAMKN